MKTTHPDVLMSSVKFAQATKSSRYPSMTDSCPVCLSMTAVRISAPTDAHIKHKPDKTAKTFKTVVKPPTADVLFCLDAMFTWTSHVMTRKTSHLTIPGKVLSK